MKKILLLATLVLGMVSCMKDQSLDANLVGDGNFVLSVALPDDATRAAGTDSAKGAIDNGVLNEYDVRYTLEVYDANGDLAKEAQHTVNAASTSFELRLIPGRHYRFVVWADFVKCNAAGEVTLAYYDVTDLTNVTLTGTHNAMNESRDAYTAVYNTATEGEGNKFSSASKIEMTLTRPFAKLRVVTNDMNEIKSYSTLQSATVKYTTPIYTGFNALDAKVTGATARNVEKTVDFTDTDAAYKYEGEPTVDGVQTLFADYIFGTETGTVQFTLDVADDVAALPQVAFNTAIPVKRNYLTTIYGPVLTDANNVTVIIDNKFEGEYVNGSDVDTTESFADALADAAESVEATIDLTGDVVWSTGAGHGSTPWIPEGAKTQKLTVNANGNKITATGAGVGAIRMANGGTLIINNAVIEDKSVSYNEGAWELGYLEFGGKLEFNECEFVNAIQLEEQANATFNKCSFNSNKAKEYAVWVCGNKAYFNKCTIEGPRGIKMHEAYGSEVEEVVIDNCKFNYISEKPGVAIGDVNADTKVVIMNSTFTNCQAGDQGLYIYETDTNVTTFTFIEEDNTIVYATASNDAFNEAIVGGMSYISLGDGEFNAPAGLNNGQADNALTITGNGIDNTTVKGATNTNNQNPGNYAHGLDLVFENLTYVTPNNGYMGGFGHAKSVTFRNCKIVGQFYAHSGAPHYFYGCIIDPLTGYLYTYASDCVFKGCTFSASEGKALQIYEDSATGENTVTIEDCAFVAAKQATTWDGKPVTGIDINSNGAKFEVYINNCTTTGFPTGLNSNSDLWNVKDAGKAHANVYVDDVQVWFAGGIAPGVMLNEAGEYLIMNATGMFWFANEVNVNKNTFSGKVVKLAENINLNNVAWTPVGQTRVTQFNGTFDGNNKTISNLKIDTTAENGEYYSTGIFGWLLAAKVMNVTVDGASIKGNHNVAAIAGYLEWDGCTVENCHVKNATIVGNYKNDNLDGDKCGAIVAYAGNANTYVKDCTATDCTVTASRDAGQIVGAGKEVNVTNCVATNVTVAHNGQGTGKNIRNEVIGRLL